MDADTFEVQACVHTVIPYVANYSLAQFFMGLIYVGNACPQKLNSHENVCIYGITHYLMAGDFSVFKFVAENIGDTDGLCMVKYL